MDALTIAVHRPPSTVYRLPFLRRLPVAPNVATVLTPLAAILAQILAVVVQIGRVMPHVAAILTDVAPFGTRLRRITGAPVLPQLSLVLRNVPRVVTNVLSILCDVAAVVTRLATILPQLSTVANGIPLMLRERLRRRHARLSRGLRPRRRREHNESDGNQR